MLRKINRMIKGFLRKKRIEIGRNLWDKGDQLTWDTGSNPIKDNGISSILFIRCDGKIGDMVVSTFMFREIKKNYPNIRIGVVTKGAAADIIKHNPNVDVIYNYDKNHIDTLADSIAKEKYDLLMEFYEEMKVTEMKFINKCRAKFNMGLCKIGWKLFNVSVNSGDDFQWTDHISKRYIAYLVKLGIKKEDIDDSYDIYFDENRIKNIDKMIEKKRYSNEKVIVLNPFGASKHRCFSMNTLCEMINKFDRYKVIILYNGNNQYNNLKLLGERYHNVTIPKDIENILDAASYIKIADIVISPDTSIIHIAAAFNRNTIGVYEFDGGSLGSGHIVWGPNRANAKLIFCPKRKSTYDDFNVNDFNMDEMVKALKEF